VFVALAPAIGGAKDAYPPRLEGVVLEQAPTFAELRARLDEDDRRTALRALHVALSEVGDGAAFVWRKSSRELQGVIKPLSVFRDSEGRICRHLSYALSLGQYRKEIEAIACRETDGNWTVAG
jgi:surface antigen